jgi:hypothetical protein
MLASTSKENVQLPRDHHHHVTKLVTSDDGLAAGTAPTTA